MELLIVRQAISCNLRRAGLLLLAACWGIGASVGGLAGETQKRLMGADSPQAAGRNNFPSAGFQADQATPSDVPTLSAEQRKQVQQMLTEFRGLRGQPGGMEKRAKLATEILLVSDAAAPMLGAVVEQEGAGLLTQYENGLILHGSAALKTELAKPGMREKVAELRRKIRDTTRIKDLTKQLIKSDIDPALKELGGILLIDPVKLSESAPAVKATRAELLQLEKQQDACAEILTRNPKLKAAGGPAVRSIGMQMKDREQAARFLAQELDAADKKTIAANRQLAGKLEKEEEAGLWELNQMRMLMGLPLLKVDLKLSAAARDHSNDMKEKNFFDHTSPVPGKKTFIQRARKFGVLAMGENIHQGSDRGADAIEDWHHSPGHHKSMFSADFGSVGLGKSGDYWTQMFGK